MVGDRAFTENAAAAVRPAGATRGERFGGFAEYLAQTQATRVRYSDEAERLLERTVRYELAPLPDGTYRRRDVRRALEETWASLAEADALGALARVRCPILVVQAALPWIGDRPYLDDAATAEQLRVAPQARHVVARHSRHPQLVRDPEPAMVAAIKDFLRTLKRHPGRALALAATQ